MFNLFRVDENRIECFAAHIVQCCQQFKYAGSATGIEHNDFWDVLSLEMDFQPENVSKIMNEIMKSQRGQQKGRRNPEAPWFVVYVKSDSASGGRPQKNLLKKKTIKAIP